MVKDLRYDLLLLFLLCAATVSAQVENVAPSLSHPGSAPPETSYRMPPASWNTFVVGLENYDKELTGLDKLDGPVKDAKNVAGMLQRRYELENVTTITSGSDPQSGKLTKWTLLKEFSSTLDRVPNPGFLFFYFGGHGLSEQDEVYLLPEDVRKGADGTSVIQRSTAIRLSDLIQMTFERRPNIKALFILDNCRSSITGERTLSGSDGLTSNFRLRLGQGAKEDQYSGLAVFYATGQNREALVSPKKKTSYFTDALIEAFQGWSSIGGERSTGSSDEISLSTIEQYIRQRVKELIEADEFKPNQVPVLHLDRLDPKSLVFNIPGEYDPPAPYEGKILLNVVLYPDLGNKRLPFDKVPTRWHIDLAPSQSSAESDIVEINYPYRGFLPDKRQRIRWKYIIVVKILEGKGRVWSLSEANPSTDGITTKTSSTGVLTINLLEFKRKLNANQ